MRRSFVMVLAVMFLLASCNNNKKQTVVTSEDGKSSVKIENKDANDLVAATNKLSERTEELKKLTPLSTDELIGMMPEEIMGMKRVGINSNTYTGTSFVSARYQSEDGKLLKLNVYDCAGEAGAGIYSLRFMTMLDFQHTDENGYQKSVTFNGGRAVEKFKKSNNEYGLTYLAKDRFLVDIEGENIELDLVRQAAGSLKF